MHVFFFFLFGNTFSQGVVESIEMEHVGYAWPIAGS